MVLRTDTIQSELCKKDLDILAKAKIAEEAIVRKAGGKFKMLPLFELDGEGDDITALAAVGLDPLRDLGQVLALLADVVLHCQVDEVDYRLGSDKT